MVPELNRIMKAIKVLCHVPIQVPACAAIRMGRGAAMAREAGIDDSGDNVGNEKGVCKNDNEGNPDNPSENDSGRLNLAASGLNDEYREPAPRP